MKLTEEQKGQLILAAQQTLDRVMKNKFDNMLGLTMTRLAPDMKPTENEVKEFLKTAVPQLTINY